MSGGFGRMRDSSKINEEGDIRMNVEYDREGILDSEPILSNEHEGSPCQHATAIKKGKYAIDMHATGV